MSSKLSTMSNGLFRGEGQFASLPGVNHGGGRRVGACSLEGPGERAAAGVPPTPTGQMFVRRDARSTTVLALPPTPGGVHTSADSPASRSPCRGIRDQSAALCISDQTKGRDNTWGARRARSNPSRGKSKSCMAPEPRNSRASVPPALNCEVHATAPLPTVRRQVVPETRMSPIVSRTRPFQQPGLPGKARKHDNY